MRLEVRAAFLIGILLPVLETYRRGLGHWAVSTMTMLEDYAAGALLLFAAYASVRHWSGAALWMLLAWSAVTTLLTTSFGYHLEATLRGESVEPDNTLVLLVKFVLWSVCVVALAGSFAHARSPRR